MTDEQLSLLQLLSSTFPPPKDPDAFITAYELALAGLPEQDVTWALQLFNSGRAPGQNPNYMPPHTLVANVATAIRDKRLGEEQRQRAITSQLTQLEYQKPGTSETRRQFAARMMQELIGPGHKTEAEMERDAAATSRRLVQHDELFGLTGRTDAEIRRALIS